jgi:hypothetical protein
VTDEGVAAICDVGKLESLAVSNTTVTDRGLKQVGRLVNLKWFYASGTQITDNGVAHLAWLAWIPIGRSELKIHATRHGVFRSVLKKWYR